MNDVTERRLIAELADLIERRSTAMADDVLVVPSATFRDPARLERERTVLFRSAYPLVVGASARIPSPGDFFTFDAAGVPILVTRTSDGRANAHLNVCRHRGHTICLDASGNRRLFSCDYHGWTYDGEGRLKAFGDVAAFAGQDPSDRSLIRLPIEERHGLLWVRTTPGTTLEVAAFLGADLDAELADFTPWMQHAWLHRAEACGFSWKLGMGTFQELFHIDSLHRSSIAGTFIGNLATYEPFGPHHRLATIHGRFREAVKRPAADLSLLPHATLIYSIFPSTVLLWQLDHLELWTVSPARDGDRNCRIEATFLVDRKPETDSAQRHWQKHWQVTEKTIYGEDFVAMARIQANLAVGSAGSESFVYGRNEIGLQHFQLEIDAALERAEAS